MNGTLQVITERDRQILNRIRERIAKAGISPDKVSPSYLRVALLAENGKSTYEFPTKKDQGVSLIHDRKLDQNDAFVITDLGLMLLGENPANPGTGLLQAYPNNQVFVAEAGNVNPLHLNCFYNGFFRVKVGDTVFAESIPTNKMLAVRTTQQASASTFSERFGNDGTTPLNPDITLNGSKKNEITLSIPTWGGQQVQYVTAATRIYPVLVAYGFLITGGSDLGSI